jgi:integrase
MASNGERIVAAVNLANKALTFRHPMLLDKKGYPKPFCKGVAKFNSAEQGQLKDDLSAILDLKPKSRDEIPKDRFHPFALDLYFKPIGRAVEASRDFDAEEKAKAEALDADTEEQHDAKMADATWIWDAAEKELAAERIAELEAQLAGIVKSTGIRSEAENSITVGQAYEHFKKHTVCKSEDARHNCVRRVGEVVTALGTETLYSALTRGMIVQTVDGIDATTKEKPKLLREFKRFCKEISWPTEADGLGLSNPTSAIKITKPKAEPVEILDPRTILEDAKYPLYWKTLVACYGFGGFRLADAAALDWTAIDWKEKIIRVRPSVTYPDLKSVMSERDVKPFENIWKWLRAWKNETGGKGLLFPRVSPRDNRGKKNEQAQAATWFRTYRGKPSAADLSGALYDRLNVGCEKDAPKFKETALRLRHFWETSMRERGLGHLIESMGGHSNEVGLKHYTRHESIVKAAKVGSL